MSSNQYALLALSIFATLNVMIDRYLTGVHPFYTIGTYSFIVANLCALSIAVRQQTGMETPSPTAQLIPTLLIFSLIMFLGDWCYYTAYQKGGPGSLPAITTIVATMPVFATIIKSILERRLPTSSQFAGCLLAVLAVYCVSRK